MPRKPRSRPVPAASAPSPSASSPPAAPVAPVQRRRDPVVDVHAHVSFDEHLVLADRPHGAAEYAAAARAERVEAAVLLAVAPQGEPARTRGLNDLVLEAEVDGVTVLPFCSVHPLDGDGALAELDRVVAAGARGVKLHPNMQRFDVADPAVQRVVARAGRLGLPVLFDAYAPSDPAQLYKFVELAVACQDTDIVLAHLGGPKFAEMMMFHVLRTYPWWSDRLWFDLSWTVPTFSDGPYREQLLWVCRKLGTDRLLFGSDYPMVDLATAVEGTVRLGFDADELDAVLHDNAAKLFSL